MADDFFSIRMRASLASAHISGAERLARALEIPRLAADLTGRALAHPRGLPDDLRLSISRLRRADCLVLPALAVSAVSCPTAEEGLAHVRRLLRSLGLVHADELLGLLDAAQGMRGAMLVDARSLQRLEPDPARGVRATLMDAEEAPAAGPGKDHYREALVLASKVAHAPGILAEICISDDPDYVTGYVASRQLGYVRIERMKAAGSPAGGRIFIYDGAPEQVSACIAYLERQPVLVRNLAPAPGFAPQPLPAEPSACLAEKLGRLREERLERKLPSPPPAGCLELASSDYLNLAGHPQVIGGACEAARQFGASGTGSRLTTGNLAIHEELELALARYCGSEASLLFSSGYAANAGVIQALCGRGDVIFSDELNHASIIDGCRLSGADIEVYRHSDMADLAARCARQRGRRGLVVSDAVFSMDGDVARMAELRETARENGFLCLLDEAHALGVLDYGRQGAPGVSADVVTGSLSKALASQGGYARGSALMMAWLLNRARSFIFSSAPAPASAGAALAALKILAARPDLPTRLRQKSAFLCARLAAHGVAARSDSAIVPVLVGDEDRTLRAAERLRQLGFAVSAIRHPSVARGAARLRLAVSLAHSGEDLERAAAAVARTLAAL